jgi:hypothetical protein
MRARHIHLRASCAPEAAQCGTDVDVRFDFQDLDRRLVGGSAR